MALAWHSITFEDVLEHFHVNSGAGLSSKQVEEQREKHGENKLDEQEQKSMLQLVIEQFEDTLVRILLASAAVSFALAYFDEASASEGITAYVEPLVILTILILNAIVGVWQEASATKALDALKKLSPDSAFCLRNEAWAKIGAEELVPGDIVEVKVGDKIPADMRVIKLKTTSLKIEQSQLTGESESVDKEVTPVAEKKDEVIQGKVNLLFASTTVSNGACVGVVIATGMKTEIGVIQSDVQRAAEEAESTPLQQKLEEFGNQLAKMIAVVCVLVWIINYKHFFDPIHGGWVRGCIYYFKIAVALAVAAIPEGLPTVITMCLALGTRKMAKRNAIVRKLPSVETLGCTTVICSDKTGTLTTNEMTVQKLAMPAQDASSPMRTYDVEGHTYNPVGAVKDPRAPGFKIFADMLVARHYAIAVLCKVGALCNESRLLLQEDGRMGRNGEPTEAAIRVLVEKIGCPDSALNERCFQKERSKDDCMAFSDYWAKGLEKRAVLEFHRDRKSMSVMYHDSAANNNILFVKGAPEMVLERCSHILLPDGKTEQLTDAWKKKVEDQISGMNHEALRTIAFAYRPDLSGVGMHDYDGPQHKEHKRLRDPAGFAAIESNMTFVAVTGIIDPPRPECEPAIANCRVAGISVIMITGDNKITAEAIAVKLGILSSGNGHQENSFTGAEFEAMPDEKKKSMLEGIMKKKGTEGAVFARTEPRHKQLIVKILKSLDEIVAMTGDGVNDAPALKQADIGIAMGIAGTEVAKEASDMVLADDNFSSIVHAVEEGRSIYNNMKAFIRYMISSNVGEVAAIFFTAAIGIPEGLAPVQLLWVNLVTDGPPATALGFNPPDLDVMERPPRGKKDALISQWSLVRYMVVGFYVGFAVVGIFVYWYVYDAAGHTLVTFDQLMGWGECKNWKDFGTPKDFMGMSFAADPCSYFAAGKVKASTLSLTVLVVIEMLNAFNALSEDGSLLQMPPWANPWLLAMTALSIGIHMIILYIPPLAVIFNVCPLNVHDWILVMAFSSPVILIDEVLKLIGRAQTTARLAATKKDD